MQERRERHIIYIARSLCVLDDISGEGNGGDLLTLIREKVGLPVLHENILYALGLLERDHTAVLVNHQAVCRSQGRMQSSIERAKEIEVVGKNDLPEGRLCCNVL